MVCENPDRIIERVPARSEMAIVTVDIVRCIIRVANRMREIWRCSQKALQGGLQTC